MHDSHKLWIMIAVFLVIAGLFVGMYLTATPSKMNLVIEKQKALNEKKKQSSDAATAQQPLSGQGGGSSQN